MCDARSHCCSRQLTMTSPLKSQLACLRLTAPSLVKGLVTGVGVMVEEGSVPKNDKRFPPTELGVGGLGGGAGLLDGRD